MTTFNPETHPAKQYAILLQAIAPKDTDLAYERITDLKIALILRMDSYKMSHPYAYPDEVVGCSSYGTARTKGDTIVPFGMQILLNKYLTQQITMKDVDDAEAFATAHFGRPLFFRKSWERVVLECNGYLPLVIRAIPEGTVVPSGMPLYSVTAIGKDFHWMASGFETIIQRGVWYPTTIASLDYSIKKQIRQLYETTGADLNLLPFALHDFGGRGVSCSEQAEIGGASHLVSFMGSDTIEGILTANHYYCEPMSGYSVYATEHSVQCSFKNGTENAIRYLRHQLNKAKELGIAILSVVIDGYDTYREVELLCTVLKDEIIASGIKVVFRPDSGDMAEVVPRILRMQAATFGYEVNEKNFKKIKHVGVIQGDGVDHKSLLNLLGLIMSMGFRADNVVFGSGGALLQKVNRDTFKFAQKASAILVIGADGVARWEGIAKDPITDPGKKSEEGVRTTIRSLMTGEYMSARLDHDGELTGKFSSEFEDTHVLVYYYGQLFNKTKLSEVRARTEMRNSDYIK